MQISSSSLTQKGSNGRCQKTPVTGRPVMLVRPVTAVPPEAPKKGTKGTQYRERHTQILTVIEPCSTEGREAPRSCTRRHPSNSGKGDLDSIRTFRQKNLVAREAAFVFRTWAPLGVERNVDPRGRPGRPPEYGRLRHISRRGKRVKTPFPPWWPRGHQDFRKRPDVP